MTASQMLAEDVLEAMLVETAETIAVPANGARDVLAAARHADAGRQSRGKRAAGWWSPGRLVLAGVGLAAVVLIGVAVSQAGHGVPTSAATSSSSVAAPAAAPALVPRAADAGGEAASSAAEPVPESTPRFGTTSDAVIVQTGAATLVVPIHGVTNAVSQLEGAAQGLGGFVQDSNVSATNATVTLRVPAAVFETLLNRLSAIGKVTTSSSTSTDVTGQSVDLAARLKAADASRDTYLTLLSRATTIGDTLSVQQRLDDLQTQIEQLQGQAKTLDAQAKYATLVVSVQQPAPKPPLQPKPTPPRTGFNLAIHQAYDSFRNGLQDVVAASGGLALFVVFLLVLAPFVKVGSRFYRRQLL